MKKLALKRETMRVLTNDKLTDVKGGVEVADITQPIPPSTTERHNACVWV